MKKRSMSVKAQNSKMQEVLSVDSEGQELEADVRKALFLGNEKIDKVILEQILELGITKKIKKCVDPGFYTYGGEKIQAMLDSNQFGKIVLLVRPINYSSYGYIEGMFVSFKEFAEKNGDVNATKTYFHNEVDIYSARQMKQLKEGLAQDHEEAERLLQKKKKRKSVAPKLKTASLVSLGNEENGHLSSGVNQAGSYTQRGSRKQTVQVDSLLELDLSNVAKKHNFGKFNN